MATPPASLAKRSCNFLAIVVRSGFLDLTSDLFNPSLNIFGRSFALNDRRIFLVDGHPLRLAEIFQRNVFKLDPKVLGKTTTTGEDRDVLQRRFAPVAEAGSFHGGHLEGAPQLVYHERRESFALDVLSDNE
jgi:hypothetical protein